MHPFHMYVCLYVCYICVCVSVSMYVCMYAQFASLNSVTAILG